MSRHRAPILPSQLPSSCGPALERSEGASAPQPLRRGGRREGAGAPRGNTNALKTGRYSARVRALEELLEDMEAYACVIGSFAGPRQEELRRLAFVLQGDAQALLSELRRTREGTREGVARPREQSNVLLRFAARTARRQLASEAVR